MQQFTPKRNHFAGIVISSICPILQNVAARYLWAACSAHHRMYSDRISTICSVSFCASIFTHAANYLRNHTLFVKQIFQSCIPGEKEMKRLAVVKRLSYLRQQRCLQRQIHIFKFDVRHLVDKDIMHTCVPFATDYLDSL